VDFYATTAQVIPVLLLALVWESGYLERLKKEDRTNGYFWTKPRVRAWGLIMSGAALVGETAMLLVLADAVGDGILAKGLGLAGVAALLGSLGVRLIVDIVAGTSS
jgi:hypothetical protein